MCRNFACKKGLKPKLMSGRWTGPWTIDKVRGPVNYRITRKQAQKTQRLLVHHDRLKPYHQRPAQLQQRDIASGEVGGEEITVPLSVSLEEVVEPGGDEVVTRVDADADNESDTEDDVASGESEDDEEAASDESEVEEQPREVARPVYTASGRKVKPTQRLIADAGFGRR